MPWNILLLPLIGGFVFIHWWYYTQYKALRLDKERLILYASLAGAGLLTLAFILKALIPPFIPCVKWFPCIATIPFDYIGESSLALLLGIVLPQFLNLFLRLDEEAAKYIREEGDPFEQLINRALESAKPVMLTLKGGKVYVGFVTSSFVPVREQKTVIIVPLRSGYREETKQRVILTTDYSRALQQIPIDVAKLKEARGRAQEQLQQVRHLYASQKLNRLPLARGGEKDKAALEQLEEKIILTEKQEAQLESAIQAYSEEIEELDTAVNDFGIVIQIDEIVTGTLYNAKVHAEYFAHTDAE